MTSEGQAHWENVYSAKGETEVSWFQETPAASLELPADEIIDVGSGASRLVDSLLAGGFAHVTALDLSAAALETARKRQNNCLVQIACRLEPGQLRAR